MYLLITISGFDKRQPIRIAKKFLLSFSFALVSLSILIAGGTIDYLFTEKVVVIYLLYLGFVVLLMVKRSLELLKTCENCEFEMRWSLCPGFHNIVCELVEQGFLKARTPS
ncbi:MAG: hypothetical protein GF411_18085 [Candidatus Lokiarchaeota archaeon]|nr:hypothetical protein [Candidatus Lokiarchaeota archaeon]